jgi:hypothetical protein
MKVTGVGLTILLGGLIGSLRAPVSGVARQPGLPAVDAVLDKYVAGLGRTWSDRAAHDANHEGYLRAREPRPSLCFDDGGRVPGQPCRRPAHELQRQRAARTPQHWYRRRARVDHRVRLSRGILRAVHVQSIVGALRWAVAGVSGRSLGTVSALTQLISRLENSIAPATATNSRRDDGSWAAPAVTRIAYIDIDHWYDSCDRLDVCV